MKPTFVVLLGLGAAAVALVVSSAWMDSNPSAPGQAKKTTTSGAATTTTRANTTTTQAATTTSLAATTTTAASTTTATLAVTTTTAPQTGCTGVQVPAGADLAAASAAAPAGATLCLAAGTYPVHAAFSPKAGQRFIGAGIGLTVIDGLGTTATSFAGYGGAPANVVLQRMSFTRFVGGGANGLLAAVKTTDGWQVLDSEFYDNRIGVAGYGNGVHVERNLIRDNWQYGVIGTPFVLADNEIARNNTQRYGTGDAGGTKFVRVPIAGISMLRNWVHDNYGPGLWCDWMCVNITYQANRVERNVIAGIFHEVGGKATITGNYVAHNGLVSGGLFYQADILSATSHEVEIVGNEVHTNANGIAVTDTDRCAGCVSSNVWVHDNTVTVDPGGKIAVGLAGRPAAFTAGNRFTANTYVVPDTAGAWWQWQPGLVTWAGWQAAGQDTTGSVS